MTERLRKGQFDQLADGIWGLGRKSMGQMIEIAPLPAFVKGELYHDGLCFEPEFEITHPLPRALERRPVHVGLTISEFEDYVKDPQFTLYSFQKLVLDTRARTKTFETGVTLMDSSGRAIMPRMDRPATGARLRRGTKEWRSVKENNGLAVFNPDEADIFLKKIEEASLAIESE